MITYPIARTVRRSIEKLASGKVFDYSFFNIEKENELSLAQALSRMTRKGYIVRLTKGKYYKPRKTAFGELKPSENEILKVVTERYDRKTGYPTGINVYNKLGLTTQISNTLVIATQNLQPVREIKGYRIKYVKRNFVIQENDIELLQLLDAIKDIKNIPDASPEDSFRVIISKLKNLSSSELKRFVKLALNYNASSRAFTGALFEKTFPDISISSLFNSLNPLSKYKVGISDKLLPNKSKWNIE